MSRLSDFKDQGFLYIPEFISAKDCLLIKEKVKSFIENDLGKVPKEKVYYETPGQKGTLKQIQHLQKYDDFFNNLMVDTMKPLANELLGEESRGINMQYFNKPPAIGKATPPHQDGFYFMLKPNHALTMWLALDDVDEENGVIKYIPGSNSLGMRKHGKTGVLGFSQGIIDFGSGENDYKPYYTQLKPGDLLVHHSLTIHYAEKNRSRSRNRRGLGFIFYADSAKEDKKAHAKYQEELAHELKAEKKI